MGGSSSKNKNTNKPVTLADSNVKPSLEISKQHLDFNLKDESLPVNTPVQDEFSLKNVSKKKIKFKFDPVCPASCQLTFNPASGTIDKGSTKQIKVKLVLLQKGNLNFKVTLRVEGGASLFINLKVTGEKGVFGVDPHTLPQVEDGSHQVPTILVEMKNLILEKGGEKIEGIFRLAGEQTEIARIKDLMNKKTFDGQTNDVNAIASLMKIWFRDLPVPILNVLPQETIMNFSDASDCIAAYNNLPEPQKTLLSWLLDFLGVVQSFSSKNKMTAQNLAIVVAPNLYDIATPNPMEGLILSQKCAQFLFQLLNARIHGTC